MRRDCDRPPDEQPGNGALVGVLCMGGDPFLGLVIAETLICLVVVDRVSLGSCSGAIHGLRLWWCRVCLLFENSIVCQVCGYQFIVLNWLN